MNKKIYTTTYSAFPPVENGGGWVMRDSVLIMIKKRWKRDRAFFDCRCCDKRCRYLDLKSVHLHTAVLYCDESFSRIEHERVGGQREFCISYIVFAFEKKNMSYTCSTGVD